MPPPDLPSRGGWTAVGVLAVTVQVGNLGSSLRSADCLFDFSFALFNKVAKLYSSILRNLDMRCRPTDAHSRDRSVDLHLAGLRYLASHKSERPLGETEEGRVGLPVRVVHKLIENDASVAREIKRAAVGQANADSTIASSLNDVAPVDCIPYLGFAAVGARLKNDRRRVLNRYRTLHLYYF